jgi:predicted metal-dependent phosphoesterase TrpH
MRLDLHIHTRASPCSVLRVEDILSRARALGLDGVCLTDHDQVAPAALEREGAQEDGFVVLVGMEYTTDQGDFLIFGPVEELPPGLPAREMLLRLRDLGGAAVLAHPFRSWRPADPAVFSLGLDLGLAVERLNGRNLAHENEKAQMLVDRFGLTATGGSDAHAADELGVAVTRFLRPVRTRAELVQALLAGDCLPELTPRGQRRQNAPGLATWA